MKQTTRLTVLAAPLAGILLTGCGVDDSPRTGSSPVATEAAACSPRTSILKSPRVGSKEVQAKALNDRGDVVGFADGRDGTFRAILWKRGKVARAVDLGVLRGYVSSEAYGVNNHRVVFGLLYDKKERSFPFRWKDGRMTVLRGPNGRRQQADVPDRNAINERGEIAGTLLVAGHRRAVRWTRKGKATFLPGLPGHAWTNAWSIGNDGVVSGWSRKLPNDDGENNPVIWTKSGEVIPLKTAPGRADGAAEATNRSGLTVGYLGNLGTDTDPESDQAAVWQTRTAEPLLIGRTGPYAYAELVDVNDRGQAAGMSGTFTKNDFPVVEPAIWRTGWADLRTLRVPAASRAHRVVATQLNDINARGSIVGDVYGLAAKDFSRLRRIYPVLWTCPFGR
jgi:probable HAF family extracellular repeat protein